MNILSHQSENHPTFTFQTRLFILRFNQYRNRINVGQHFVLNLRFVRRHESVNVVLCGFRKEEMLSRVGGMAGFR